MNVIFYHDTKRTLFILSYAEEAFTYNTHIIAVMPANLLLNLTAVRNLNAYYNCILKHVTVTIHYDTN